MPPTFAEVEAIVGQLDEQDRTKLGRQLVRTPVPPTGTETADDAVANLRRVLDRIGVAPLSGTEVLSLDRESRACTLSTLASGLAQPPQASETTR